MTSQEVVLADGTVGAEAVSNRLHAIQSIVTNGTLQEGLANDFAVIPGTGSKRTLLKAGAEKLMVLFQLAPEYQVSRSELKDDHREYEVTCRILHQSTGNFLGAGVGVCSTMESKYRYRQGNLICPKCGVEAVLQSKKPGEGFFCWKKKEGCGANFEADDESITKQEVGRVENADIADTYNTVLKMAKKRALIDATLTVTAASSMFTQDVEDLPRDTRSEADAKPLLAKAMQLLQGLTGLESREAGHLLKACCKVMFFPLAPVEEVSSDALSPAQAQTLIDTLQDEKERKSLVEAAGFSVSEKTEGNPGESEVARKIREHREQRDLPVGS